MKASQIKTSQNKGEKANKGKPDTLLGDPTVNTKVHAHKAKEKGQNDMVGIDDIGIFEFIFQGLPNSPDLEGMGMSYKMPYKSNYAKGMKKEKEILLKEFKTLRKHLIL